MSAFRISHDSCFGGFMHGYKCSGIAMAHGHGGRKCTVRNAFILLVALQLLFCRFIPFRVIAHFFPLSLLPGMRRRALQRPSAHMNQRLAWCSESTKNPTSSPLVCASPPTRYGCLWSLIISASSPHSNHTNYMHREVGSC